MGRKWIVWDRLALPDGQPCLPGASARSPQQILAAHGLVAGEVQLLDEAHGVRVTAWRRA